MYIYILFFFGLLGLKNKNLYITIKVMDYEKLEIKDEFLGKYLLSGGKNIQLSALMTPKEKSFIWNCITKKVFKTKEEMKVKTVHLDGVVKLPEEKLTEEKQPKKRGRKPKNNDK